MNDDTTDGVKPNEHDGQILLYDFFKFLTTLALLILGGVLSLTASGRELNPRALLLVVGLLATAGISAISGADRIVRARIDGKPLNRTTRMLQYAAMMCLGMGTGAFLTMWLGD